MKNVISTVKNKLVSRYLVEHIDVTQIKSTNINILLNRVKLDQQKEKIKKLLFSAAATTGVLVFSILIF
tara:strand:+ start:1450 stop:1656 length:207 start_codon:yes stop_codon:yes gene_type:complete